MVEALGYYGWFPEPQSPISALAIPNSTYFPRSNFLYESQFFSQVSLHVDNFQSDILTSPTLLELTAKLVNFGANVSIPQNVTSPNTCISLLAARYLAQYLSQSEVLTLTLQRNSNYPDIPVDKVISFDSQQYYCIQAVVDFKSVSDREVENMITLTGVPIGSITGAWGQ